MRHFVTPLPYVRDFMPIYDYCIRHLPKIFLNTLPLQRLPILNSSIPSRCGLMLYKVNVGLIKKLEVLEISQWIFRLFSIILWSTILEIRIELELSTLFLIHYFICGFDWSTSTEFCSSLQKVEVIVSKYYHCVFSDKKRGIIRAVS